MNKEIQSYNKLQNLADRKIVSELMRIIDENLKFTESKIWHAHPVWFIKENPIVGYSMRKDGVRLMFWSGIDFEEPDLKLGTGKFKDASVTYTNVKDINEKNIKRWLKKAENIQWDYKNIVKRKGKLERLV
jgi:hypothetical protein